MQNVDQIKNVYRHNKRFLVMLFDWKYLLLREKWKEKTY